MFAMIKVGATIGKLSERDIVVGGGREKQITVVSDPTTKGRRVFAPIKDGRKPNTVRERGADYVLHSGG